MRVPATISVALATVTVVALPAAAQTTAIDLPAGSAGQQVMALGRLAHVSVAVSGAPLWSTRLPRLHDRMSVDAALRLIARRSHAEVEAIGPRSWRLVPSAPTPVVAPAGAPIRRAEIRRAAAPPADIVVTASKRGTAYRNFAGQIAIVPGGDLALGGAGGSERLADRLTAVASTELGPGRNKLFIRGIADSSFTGPTQATVGQYFGDLRLSYNSPDPDLRLSDLAAVEVLEGPQGTLYGAGSLGGLIRLVPNAPDPAAFGGSVAVGGSATMHGSPGADAQLVLNVPIVRERLAVRVVADAASEGGYVDKPLIGRADVNRTVVEGGRAAAHLDLVPGWSVELVGIGQRIRGADSQYADRQGPPLSRSAPVAEGFRSSFGQAQMVLSGALGAIRLRSTGGATAHDLMERYDATVPGSAPRLFAQANRTRMTANETRVWTSRPDGSGWLAGFSYLRNESRLTRLYGPPDDLRPIAGVMNGISETTLYGEGSLRVLPGLLATGGARVTRSILDGEGTDVSSRVTLAQLAITATRRRTIALPSGSVLIDLTPRMQTFLRYQQGFRPGGLAIEGDFVRRFRDDRVATLEAGLRYGRRGSDRRDATLTLAHTAWRDIQADFIDGAGLPSTANVGDGTLWTAEFTTGVRVGTALRIETAATFNDGRIDDASTTRLRELVTAAPGGGDASRRLFSERLSRIPNIAGFTARTGAIYRWRLDDARDLTVDGWLRYVGSSRLGVGPVLGERQGGYLDSAVTLRLRTRAIGMTLGVTNVADVRGNRFSLGTPFATGRDQVTPLRPRTLRMGLDGAF